MALSTTSQTLCDSDGGSECNPFRFRLVSFPRQVNNPYTKNVNRDIWSPAWKETLGHLAPLNQAGRHSRGSRMYAAGADMETISAGLGDSSTKITKRPYSSPLEERLPRAVDNLRSIDRSIRKNKDDQTISIS